MDRKRKSGVVDCPCLNGDCGRHQLMESMPPQERLKIIDDAIAKAQKIFDDYSNTQFTLEESINIYSCAFTLTGLHASPNCASQLFEKFVVALLDSIFAKVLPSLRNKADAPSLLSELMQVWPKYKALAQWLSKFLEPLDRFYFNSLGMSLYYVSVVYFTDLVCGELFSKFQDAAICLITEERVGNPTSQVQLLNVVNFFLEIGEYGRIEYYEKFEHAMLQYSASYFSRLASEWLSRDRVNIYMEKVERCLHHEEVRMGVYLPQTTIPKLLEVVRCQFVDNQVMKLIELIFEF